MKTIRRPISILLAILMVVGMFTMVPISAGAAVVDYYVVGSMNSWNISEDYKMVLNENNTSEYWIQNVPLHNGDEIKVVSSTDGSTVQYWYPGGSDNNLTISEDGYYNVYVAPAGHDSWHYNCILATKQSDLNYVAQIGTAKYETLAAAVEAAQDYDEITLLADCTVDSQINVDKDITINGAGKTITCTYADDYATKGSFANGAAFQLVGNEREFYIVDATLDGNGVGTVAINAYRDNGNDGNVIDLTNVTVKNFIGYEHYGAIKLFSHADLYAADCTFVDNALSNNTQGYAGGADIWAGGAATVYLGGTSAKSVGLNGTSGGGADLTLDIDSHVAALNISIDGYNNPDVRVSLNDEDSSIGAITFKDTPEGDDARYVAKQLGEYTTQYTLFKTTKVAAVAPTYDAPGNIEYYEGNDGKYYSDAAGNTEITLESTVIPALTAVAQVGETKYETLEDAIAAAPAGATVKLLADIDYSEVTKNRNAHDRGEELKIDLKDLTLDLNGKTITTVNASVVFTGNGATIENGNFALNHIDATGAAKNGSYGLCIDGYDVANGITLNDLNIEGGINIWDADVEINNVTATATASNFYALWAEGNSNVTVNSGTFSDNGTAKAKGPVATDKTGTGTLVTIKGGTFNATNKVVNAAAPGSIEISGGTFTKAVPAEYCADGYDPKENGDGTYTVAPHEHDWDYENVTWTFTENASHSIYAKYTLTCKTDPTHTKEQTGSGTLMSTVAVDGDKFVYSHSAVKIDGISVAVPNYTRNIADGIINQNELKAAVKVAGNYKLANDITGFYDNVKPVDGFVLDGQNHMIKYGTMNASNRVMFVAADQNTKFTLKNITLDGNNKAKWAVCAYTGNSGNNAGNVITLDTVTIQNFKSNDYVGAINAFGSSTWNLKDCTITGNTTVDDSDGLSGSAVWAGSKATINIDGGTYDEVYLHSYSGTGAVLNADGGATIDNLVLDLTKTDTLKANIDEATVGAITSNEGTIPEEAVVMDPAKATVAAPEGYKWVDSDETGMKTLAQIVYVAQIDETKYETLEAAFAAAQDGDTIIVLADSAGNGIKAPQGKFATGLTVDFNNHTYTVDGTTVGSTGTETQAFQLLKDNTITFKNGTLTSDKAQMIIQNYSNLTLDNMTIDGTQMAGDGNYALSNNNGNVVIKDTTISAREGCIAFDVCRYASYPSVHVTVTGDSVINGDVEIYASKGQAKEGFSLTLESGTMTGDIVVAPSAATAMAATPAKASVNKKNSFNQDPAEGYVWRDNGNGTSTLVKIPNLFVGNGLALHGDIGVIFYLNPEAAGFTADQVTSVSVDFACDKYSGTVEAFTKDDATGYIKVAYYVPVAYMASDVLAYNVKINGLPAIGTDTYSVQDYALDTINDPNAPDARKTLMKEMLNYGAKAKAVFESQMANPEDAVYEEIPDYTITEVTAAMIEDAIEGEATDMSTVTPEPGAKFYGSSVIYLSETTLRMVFAIPDGSGSKLPENAYTGHQGKWYHWVDKKNIPAAELHKQQNFTVGDATFHYSALDYAKAVLNSNMDQKNKDLVSAMYLYNQAAIACFA